MILVDATGVAMSRPGKPLFADLSVTVATGDRLGVVGINGCGKSTLLQVLAGSREPEEGTVRRGRDARVSVLDQDAPLPAGTVRDVVGGGWEAEGATPTTPTCSSSTSPPTTSTSMPSRGWRSGWPASPAGSSS